MRVSLLSLPLCLAVFGGPVFACVTNTACTYDYVGQDACYMEATYGSGSKNEAFCDGGSIFSGGNCRKKKSLGEYCSSNDNNDCVTKFCNSSTGKCEQRTSGCASFGDCTGLDRVGALNSLLSGITNGVASFTNSNPGSAEATAADCASPGDPNAACTATVASTAADSSLPAVSDVDQGKCKQILDGVEACFTVNANIRGNPEFNNNLPKLRFSAAMTVPVSLTGMAVKLKFTKPISSEVTKSFLLTDKSGVCSNPDPDADNACEPVPLISKAVKIGEYSLFVQVGVQMAAIVKGSVSVEGSGEISYTIPDTTLSASASLTVDGKQFSNTGFSISDTSLSSSAPTLTPDNLKFTAEAKASVDLTVVLAASVSFKLQGIPMILAAQFGANLKAQTAAALSTDGCLAAGAGAAVVGGLSFGYYVPSVPLGKLMDIGCDAVLSMAAKRRLEETDGDVHAAFETSPLPRRLGDSYGTQCQYYDVQANKAGVCSTMTNVFADMIGRDVPELASFSSCSSVSAAQITKAQLLRNGGSCSAAETVDISSWADTLDCNSFKSELLETWAKAHKVEVAGGGGDAGSAVRVHGTCPLTGAAVVAASVAALAY